MHWTQQQEGENHSPFYEKREKRTKTTNKATGRQRIKEQKVKLNLKSKKGKSTKVQRVINDKIFVPK